MIIPSAPDFLSTKGLNLLIRTISRVRRQINPKLKIDGILMTMDLASLKTELVKEQNKARTEEDADVRSGSDKPHNDDFVKELFGEDPEKHIVEENPLTGRTEAEGPSESTLQSRWAAEMSSDRPSVREAMKTIRQERAASQPRTPLPIRR